MDKRVVHVAAAVLRDAAGRVLLAQRLPHQHLAGLWEFPGGKLEPGETLAEGLRREIREELDVEVEAIAPLVKVRFEYPDKTVLLDTWRVTRWSGEPRGVEGQPLRWVYPHEMIPSEFPPADVPVIDALRLPSRYIITPDIVDAGGEASFLSAVAQDAGIRLVQVRLKRETARVPGLLAALRRLRPEARLLVNSDSLDQGSGDATGDAAGIADTGALSRLSVADGLHLTSRALMQATVKPASFCGASCHDARELAKAHALGLDFVTLSPVLHTATHPQAGPLGWAAFALLAAGAGLPVYALGGLSLADEPLALAHGAIGIAGIRGIISLPPPA